MQIAKTVAGIYLLDGDEVVDSEAFTEEDLPGALVTEHRLEQEHDAEPAVLSIERIAELSGLSPGEVRERQVDAARELTRQEISKSGDRDRLLVQAVRALEDVEEQGNELGERLRPWYSIHFPELADAVDDSARFAELVAAGAHRSEIDADAADPDASTGMDITEADAAMLERFAGSVADVHALRDELEMYVEELAEAVAPNLSAVCGPVLAARLVSLAGSLEDLAKMPSSTIQVLGAEKAMFRHVKGEGDAPKHGVLFMHPAVSSAPADATGKLARVVANKAAIAARLDRYGGDFRGEELRDEVEATLDEVR